MATAVRIEVLRVEAERVRVGKQPLAERPGAIMLADLRERRHEPERARDERLAAGGLVKRLVAARLMTEHDSVLDELVGNGEDRVADAVVVARQEPRRDQEQCRRVQVRGVVVHREDAALVQRVRKHVLADLVGDGLPALRQIQLIAKLSESRPAIAGDPAHRLRRRVVLRLAP